MATFTDLSGITANTTDPNPYNALLKACNNDPTLIRDLYQKHRTTRASQQRELLTSPTFPGVTIDPVLRKLLEEEARSCTARTGYTDPRFCAVFWGRPPQHIKELIVQCQKEIAVVLPHVYFQPLENLHITVLELAYSLTEPALAELLSTISDYLAQKATDLPHDTANSLTGGAGVQARLHRPMLTYDGSALAISFLPVAPQSVGVNGAVHGTGTEVDNKGTGEDEIREAYTYHHLRRDMWSLFHEAGIPVASRYVVPSAHLTIARFVSTEDTATNRVPDARKMDVLVRKIEEVNGWLEREYWGEKGQWAVGQEVGLVFRKGTVWYGGGETAKQGQAI